jgi:signal transduction histidine kinase
LNEWSHVKSLEINLNLFPENKLNELPNNIKIELYRIIQELMNNIIKHSKATLIDIQMIVRDESVNLMVEDNGIGYNTDTSIQDIGLKSIHAKVKSLNGSFNVESALEKWTLSNVEIPIHTETHNS